MKILFLSHRVPFPPNKGDKIRSFHILKYLHERHDVYVACPVDNKDDLNSVKELQNNGYKIDYEFIPSRSRYLNVAKRGLSGSPLSIGNFWSNRLSTRIKSLVLSEKFDALFVFSSTMAEYAKELDIPVRIIDFCDLDSAKFEQFSDFTSAPKSWLYKIEGKRLAKYEQSLLPKYDHILFISPEEKRLYTENNSSEKVKTMSNGVVFENAFDDNSQVEKLALSPYILITGVMDYLPNVDAAKWFAENVFLDLKKLFPTLSFYIVGKDPVASVRELHNPNNDIHVTGFVKNIEPYLVHASAFVAPLRIARGMQTKILEAMAYNIPVVSSRASMRGLGATEEQHVLAADESYEFVRQISRVLSNEPLANRLRANARDFIKENFDWDTNLGLLDDLLEG